MAANATAGTRSFSDVVASSDEVKPVCILESCIFGNAKPKRYQWINHVEMYKAISAVVQAENIKGLQRVGAMWRVYVDNMDGRVALVTDGMTFREMHVSFDGTNPFYIFTGSEQFIGVRITNLPLSADDEQIRKNTSAGRV